VTRSLAVVAVALVCVARGAAATGHDPLDPLVSPDGSKIAWVEGFTSRIWVANESLAARHEKPQGTNPDSRLSVVTATLVATECG
jgi:hypothetical protein